MIELISVIIPAYNAEKTIERCLNSVINQTYNNLEIIVVNDGSTDNTETVVKSLAAVDGRVRLITIENGGVSHARNTGIDSAKGEYITFVDSDDYIDDSMYESLLNLIKKYNVKIAHCSYKNVDENKNVISIVGNTNRIVIQNHDEAIECLIGGKLFAGGLWNKLYSSELFDGCRLDESIRINEDVLLNFILFDKIEKSAYTDNAYYNYVANLSSSTHTSNAYFKYNQSLYVSKIILEESQGKSYEQLAERRVADNVLGLYKGCVFSRLKRNSFEYRNVLNKVIHYKKVGYYPFFMKRMQYVLFRYFPHIFLAIYDMYDCVREKKLDPEQ